MAINTLMSTLHTHTPLSLAGTLVHTLDSTTSYLTTESKLASHSSLSES